jgi:hypothetical protein
MGRKMPIQLGGQQFPTQKSAGDALRLILHGQPLNTPLTGSAHKMLTDLIALHPEATEKIGAGIQHFEVRENHAPMCKVTKGFWVVRTDGSAIDFSYPLCLKGTPKSLSEQLALACRDAVRADVHTMKEEIFARDEDEEGFVQCSETGELLLWEWAHIDHAPPLTFESIVRDFLAILEGEGLVMERGWFSKDGERLFTTFSENGLAERFRAYHNQVCKDAGNLRLVSQSFNLRQRRLAL